MKGYKDFYIVKVKKIIKQLDEGHMKDVKLTFI